MATSLSNISKSQKAIRYVELLRQYRPVSRRDIANYLHIFLGLTVPDKSVCADHHSPMDYLWHSFCADRVRQSSAVDGASADCSADCLVWANRGGGKTLLAAAATLLDGLFKPNCRIAILAASKDQAQRLYGYLLSFLDKGFMRFVVGKPSASGCQFVNGTRIWTLAHSAADVRGRHLHKLRCDEIELFEPEIFQAAQYTAKSGSDLVGAVEMFSTFHQPYGIMRTLLDQSAATGLRLFRWCIWEVIERCLPDRSCSRCKLSSDCGGKARQAAGFFRIDDCIRLLSRVSRAGFESEMLCRRPRSQRCVFAEFDPAVHIAPLSYRPDLPLYRAIDFGFVNPFVCLWLQTDRQGRIFVLDEYVQRGKTVTENAKQVLAQTPCAEASVSGTFCDPAGAQRSDLTGSSAIRQLAAAGIVATYRKSGIVEGIEKIRAALKTADGAHRLIIDPKCRHLIDALQGYRYPDNGASELPLKDGVYDHPIDALRYFFANFDAAEQTFKCY